jgi:hypothetical protein
MLKESIKLLKGDAARYGRFFSTARDTMRELSPYPSVAALLAVFEPGAAVDYATRDALAVAILVEHQNEPHSLWTSVLAVAFQEALVGARAKLKPRDSEDLDQEILAAFFAAIRTVRTDKHALVAVRWALGDAVAAEKQKVRRATRTSLYDEDLHGGNPFAAHAETVVEALEVARLLEERGGGEVLRAIVATETEGESLRDYAARTNAGASDVEAKRAYDRLVCARKNAVRAIREELTQDPPQEASL